MAQISNLVRQTVRTRLADRSTGFNFWLDSICATTPYRIAPFVIDFADDSKNFWQSNVSAEQLDASTPSDSEAGATCRLYTVRSENKNYEKFTLFAGDVQIAVDFDVNWPSSFVLTDTESLCDATEDAMVKVFNSSLYYGAFINGVIWNGLIQCNRGPLRESGPGSRQTLAFLLTFELHA